jgi:DNA replication and repair protein RecF
VPLQHFACENFRCIELAELDLDPHYNLIFGNNASGKTSLLEAIAYLGRGKSFRGAATQDGIRHGCNDFVLRGRVDTGSRQAMLGVRNSRDGLEIKIDGDRDGGAAALATMLPLQVIDPDVHDLVAGAPEQRRRYLDWMAFHVEPNYLGLWRRFRRALKQRNAALRSGVDGAALAGWDTEFCDTAAELHETRLRITDFSGHAIEEAGEFLLQAPVAVEYRQGWPADKTLMESLKENIERDRQAGTTHAGPQRADLKLIFDERRARKLVSRGQQKLLACALVLAATDVVQTHLEKPLLLLVDDPAAELDHESLARLMASVIALGCQIIATALGPDTELFPEAPRLFHVERGSVQAQP